MPFNLETNKPLIWELDHNRVLAFSGEHVQSRMDLRDPDALAESVRRAVRAAVNEEWGKKPLCFVHVLVV